METNEEILKYQFEFIKRRYRTVPLLLRLEDIITQEEVDYFVDGMEEQDQIALLQRNYILSNILHDNLMLLSLEEQADFLCEHLHFKAIELQFIFGLDFNQAQHLFEYLKLCNVGKLTKDHEMLIITDKARLKEKVIAKLGKGGINGI